VLPRPRGFDGGLFGERRTLGFTPVSRDEMYMFLLQPLPDNPWIPQEQWPERFMALVHDYRDIHEVRELTADLGPHSRINYRPLEWLFVPAPWHKGHVVLIGDAVHATTPHTAYGAGLAVEDAIVLSELVATEQPLPDMFDTFTKRRCDRSRAVVETAVAIGQFQLRPGTMEELGRIVDAAHAAVALPAYG
jgi:2-polyprenyl-6-methoxyphenol hydroxylase-like FAD-dependent oxidoreductase